MCRQEAEELATELRLRFYRICVKDNLYVTDGDHFDLVQLFMVMCVHARPPLVFP